MQSISWFSNCSINLFSLPFTVLICNPNDICWYLLSPPPCWLLNPWALYHWPVHPALFIFGAVVSLVAHTTSNLESSRLIFLRRWDYKCVPPLLNPGISLSWMFFLKEIDFKVQKVHGNVIFLFKVGNNPNVHQHAIAWDVYSTSIKQTSKSLEFTNQYLK